MVNKNRPLKVGDYVYYIDFTNEKRFCTITEIVKSRYFTSQSHLRIYGYWHSIGEKPRKENTWIEGSRCFLAVPNSEWKQISTNLSNSA